VAGELGRHAERNNEMRRCSGNNTEEWGFDSISEKTAHPVV